MYCTVLYKHNTAFTSTFRIAGKDLVTDPTCVIAVTRIFWALCPLEIFSFERDSQGGLLTGRGHGTNYWIERGDSCICYHATGLPICSDDPLPSYGAPWIFCPEPMKTVARFLKPSCWPIEHQSLRLRHTLFLSNVGHALCFELYREQRPEGVRDDLTVISPTFQEAVPVTPSLEGSAHMCWPWGFTL